MPPRNFILQPLEHVTTPSQEKLSNVSVSYRIGGIPLSFTFFLTFRRPTPVPSPASSVVKLRRYMSYKVYFRRSISLLTLLAPFSNPVLICRGIDFPSAFSVSPASAEASKGPEKGYTRVWGVDGDTLPRALGAMLAA